MVPLNWFLSKFCCAKPTGRAAAPIKLCGEVLESRYVPTKFLWNPLVTGNHNWKTASNWQQATNDGGWETATAWPGQANAADRVEFRNDLPFLTATNPNDDCNVNAGDTAISVHSVTIDGGYTRASAY